jgi:TetR/AcrR family transcriptional regulator
MVKSASAVNAAPVAKPSTARTKLAWTRRASTEDRRKEIFRSLGLALRERGVALLTMQDIAGRLGITKGNLYYYFKDKQDLIYRCHLACMRVSLDALAESRRSKRRAGERLRAVLAKHIRAITDEVYGAVMLTDLESLTPLQRRRYVAMRDRFERGVRQLIHEGIAAGEFRRVDPRVAGFAILGAINWIPKWYDPRGELSAAEIAQMFTDFLVRSLEA